MGILFGLIGVGLWVGFLWPQFRIAALHIIFLGGFSLMIFSFGMLIVLSHSAKAALINSRLTPMKFIGSFVRCLAASIRNIDGDFMKRVFLNGMLVMGLIFFLSNRKS